MLALTNTTAANNESPVSSSSTGPLRQNGKKSAQDLANNPMRAAVAARLAALGVTGISVHADDSIEAYPWSEA